MVSFLSEIDLAPNSSSHLAHFHPRDEFPSQRVALFLAEGLFEKQAVVAILTTQHQVVIAEELRQRGFAVDALQSSGRLKFLDAEETLDALFTDGKFDLAAFERLVEAAVRDGIRLCKSVRAYGEMVGILTARKRFEDASLLETGWATLCSRYAICLLCCYTWDNSIEELGAATLLRIGSMHDQIVHGHHHPETTNDEQVEKILRERTEELARSNAELAQFAKVASHDIKEPLRMMRIYAQMLEREMGPRLYEKEKQALDNVTQGAKHAYDLIDALLEYSSVGAHAKREVVNTNQVVAHAKQNLNHLVEELHAEIESTMLPSIVGNVSLLTQLFQNLLMNAMTFTAGRQPRIQISVARRSTDWVFSVRDNGIGIEPKFFEKIFVIYQKLHPRTRYPGTGIGLAICKKIVDWHGGKIWVESVVGEGSTFSFSIPQISTSKIVTA